MTTRPNRSGRKGDRPIRWQDVCDLDVITESEAATLIRLTPQDLEALRSEKAGPPFVRFGSAIRYPVVELKRWIREQLRLNRNRQSETQACVRDARARDDKTRTT